MRELNIFENYAVHGGTYTLTLVVEVPSNAASSVGQIATSVATSTIKSIQDLTKWISSLEKTGTDFNTITISSITFSNIVL